MARTRKTLHIDERHIYTTEITHCPHCGAPLRTQRYSQWRKTVQHLDKGVYVASRGKVCDNPHCPHTEPLYSAAAAQPVTLPGYAYGVVNVLVSL